MLALQSQVMGMEDASARLHKQVLGRQRVSPPLRPLALVCTFLFSRGVDFSPSLFLSLLPFLQSWVKR